MGMQIDELAAQVGGAADTTALRARLKERERAAYTLQQDVEGGLRGVRVVVMQGGPDAAAAAPSLEKLAKQYGDVKTAVAAALRKSEARQRQYVVRADAAPPVVVRNVLHGLRPGGNEADDGEGGIQLTALGGADAALAEERAGAARAIAADAAALHELAADLGGIVAAAAPQLDKIEAAVDTSGAQVTVGVADLAKADQYQNAYWRK